MTKWCPDNRHQREHETQTAHATRCSFKIVKPLNFEMDQCLFKQLNSPLKYLVGDYHIYIIMSIYRFMISSSYSKGIKCLFIDDYFGGFSELLKTTPEFSFIFPTQALFLIESIKSCQYFIEYIYIYIFVNKSCWRSNRRSKFRWSFCLK